MHRPTAAASDDALTRAWQQGDQAAGSELIRRHQAAVQRFLRRRLGRGDTEDTVQDVWVAVSSTIHRYERRSSFRTWLFAVANNHVRVAYRHQVRDGKVQALLPAVLDVPPLEPDEVYGRRDALHQLAAGLDRLPDPLQRIITLYYFEHRSAAEIGRRLAIPENTVRSRVRRARKLLLETIVDGGLGQWIADDRCPLASWLEARQRGPSTQPLFFAA